jgi:hypothetical protein
MIFSLTMPDFLYKILVREQFSALDMGHCVQLVPQDLGYPENTLSLGILLLLIKNLDETIIKL